MADRIRWIGKMMRNGLEISVAFEKPRREKLDSLLAVHGRVPKGLLESVPIEFAPEPVKGESQLFIDCIWVLPPFWHKGVAKCLMKSFIERARPFGGASVLAYDGDRWFDYSLKYMPVSFFNKFGFEEVARDGSRILLFLDLGAGKPPKFIYPRTEPLRKEEKIFLDVLYNSQCPWYKWMVDDILRNTRKYPQIALNTVSTDDRKIIEEFGMSRGVRINGNPVICRMASWKQVKTEVERILKELH